MGRVAPGLALFVLLLMTLVPAATSGSEPILARRLVSLDGQPPAPGALLGGARVVEAFPFADLALVEASPDVLARLHAVPGVAGVYAEEPVALHLERTRSVIDAEPTGAAWPSGEGVTIALVDSGLDATHPDFEGRVAANVRIGRSGGVADSRGDDEGHGTHVAGILAGSGAASRDQRLHGIAPGARLVGVDISDSFTTTSAVRAFAWIHEHRAEHGIKVVSNSWGREKDDAHYDADDPVIRASDALVADGLVVVFSAGNLGREGEQTLTTEAMNPNVLTVGSASGQGRREAYSSQGPAVDARGGVLSWTKPDLMAPGSAIVSTRTSATAPAGSDGEARHYVMMNGTSMAAPQVAAAAALLLAQHPDMSPQMVAAILQGTARDLDAPGPDTQTGFGMLDVAGALQAAQLMLEGEQRVVVERRVPIRLTGSVAAASGLVLLNGDAPSLPPAEEVSLPIALPGGAARADLHFNWSGSGEFAVTLESSDGRAWAFEPAGRQSLRLGEAVGPGSYRVIVRPTGVAAHTTFTVEGGVLVREERIVEVPTEFHARPFTAQGGFYLPADSAGRILNVVGQAPVLALALMSGLACVVGVRLRAKK